MEREREKDTPKGTTPLTAEPDLGLGAQCGAHDLS